MIVFKALVVFKVNSTSQLILLYPRLCILHAEFLKEPLKEDLYSLVGQGILAKVTEPTNWVNSLVCVTKNTGALRLYLDPKDLSQAIKRPHYFTPTLKDVLPKLSGAKCFSILYARSGYWNIRLDQESSLYTTFNSPVGRYRFLRLPFFLICAKDVPKVDETFGNLAGVTGIADDIVVYGYNRDFSDHDDNLRAVLQRARETGLRFNLDKCKFRCTRIPYFGHIVGVLKDFNLIHGRLTPYCSWTHHPL